MTLQSPSATYAMAVTDDGYLLHLHWGAKVKGDLSYILFGKNPYTLAENLRDKGTFMDSVPLEFPCHGTGDYREPCIMVRDKNNASTVDLKFKGTRTMPGKPKLDGLPATFARLEEIDPECPAPENSYDCATVVITLEDDYLKLRAELFYTVFGDLDVITRSVKLTNFSDDTIYITRVLSSCVDFNHSDFDMLTLNGSWARERIPCRAPLHRGKQSIDSVKGESSHQSNPFFALLSPNTDEDTGEAYGFNLCYSGDFFAGVEVTQHGCTRAVMGLNPFDFSWKLEPGETFTAPECVMVYSNEGLGKMSRTYHDLYRNNLIRSEWNKKLRPVLINNWEATYFNFDTDKLIAIAKEAAKCGIEMLVLDDGWFGHRDSDNSSLGDWVPYEKKLPGGLSRLVGEVNALGMKFGLWFEPEMVSPDSDLYRAHPEWAIHIEGRELTESRGQYVLDFSNPAVIDNIKTQMKTILDSANIEYIKWDMNRQLTEIASTYLPVERQRELRHRYVLGVYELMEWLVTSYPHILLENCSGGGARFDPGMLYFSPQIWCSDNTDAIERLKIQYGTSICYPVSSIGSHVSDCPNHTVGRVTPFETRGNVAMVGTFGYELDITKIPSEDREKIPGQIARYKKYAHIMRDGDQYRLAHNTNYDAFVFVTKNKSEALLTVTQILARPNYPVLRLKLRGLNPEAEYTASDGNIYSGSALMNCGIEVPLSGDFDSRQVYFYKV
ncbi:MAG: alpha-galactosidase [Ruminococcus sp.]|nr:alpha-galactosidase [Ruminococcus sp.]